MDNLKKTYISKNPKGKTLAKAISFAAVIKECSQSSLNQRSSRNDGLKRYVDGTKDQKLILQTLLSNLCGIFMTCKCFQQQDFA